MQINLYKLIIVISMITLMPINANCQRRMMSTKSSSELLRMTNPPVINSVGKIEGTEINRSRTTSNQKQINQQDYFEEDSYYSEDQYSDESTSRTYKNDENNPDIGFAKF